MVPDAGMMATVRALAATSAANGPLALQATKELMWAEVGTGAADGVGKWAGKVFGSDDAKEGAVAFAEKRAPKFQGR